MRSCTFNRVVFFLLMMGLLMFGGILVYKDPFFHYHSPINDDYHLDGKYARYYNDGFLKFFEYDAIILGTSMCNNFRTSTLQNLFDIDTAIKVNASGSYFNETNVYLQEAFDYNNEIKMIVRSIDLDCLTCEKDEESIYAQEAYYLRDDNVLNDVNYILNKSVMLESCKPSMNDWDEYLSWRRVPTGRELILKDSEPYPEIAPLQRRIDNETYQRISENINQNIVDIMKENPNTVFYLFFTPYSICLWGDWFYAGELEVQIQAQKIAIEQILQCDNAHLFSLCNNFDMVCDLDNYIDKQHYAEWINEDILYCMYQGDYEITFENYREYLEEIETFYMDYPYNNL